MISNLFTFTFLYGSNTILGIPSFVSSSLSCSSILSISLSYVSFSTSFQYSFLSYSDMSDMFVFKTYLLSLLLLFPLILSHLHRIYSTLFITSFPLGLIFLIFFQRSFPPLIYLISSAIFLRVFLFLSLSVLSL